MLAVRAHHVALRHIPHAIFAKDPLNVQGKYIFVIVKLNSCETMRCHLDVYVQGWMYESRAPGSKVSLTTLVWASVVKVLSGWNKPRLYSFQGSLPRLPLPAVKDTMRRVSLTTQILYVYVGLS